MIARRLEREYPSSNDGWRLRLEPLRDVLLGPGGRRNRSLAGRRRVARSLVVAEIAASLVLVIGSGLFIRSFANMLAVEPGFSTDRALTLQFAVPESSAPASRRAFFQQVVNDTAQLPGVVAAGLVSELPLALQFNDVFFHVEGRPPESAAQRVTANYRRVTPGYFRAMEIPLRRGRLPTSSEVERRAPVALIDERLADRFFAAEDPIGRRVVVEFGEPLTLEIVGGVGSILDGSWRREPHQTIYVPDIETPLSMTLVARTAGPPGELANAMRNVVTAIDPEQPVSNLATLADATAGEFARPRFRTLLLGGFSALGAALAAMGLYWPRPANAPSPTAGSPAPSACPWRAAWAAPPLPSGGAAPPPSASCSGGPRPMSTSRPTAAGSTRTSPPRAAAGPSRPASDSPRPCARPRAGTIRRTPTGPFNASGSTAGHHARKGERSTPRARLPTPPTRPISAPATVCIVTNAQSTR